MSYIFLGGRCRSCSIKIPFTYPLIEFVTASIAVVLFLLNGPTIHFVADLSLAAILLVSAVIDSKHMIIPDRLNITGAIIATIFSISRGFDGIVRSIKGACVGLFILSVMFWLGKLFFKREGVGFGDIKLAFVIGIFVGPFWCFIALLLSVVTGGIWGIVQLTAGFFSGKTVIGIRVPFGPFIALGGFLVLFFRIQILYLVEQYLSLF